MKQRKALYDHLMIFCLLAGRNNEATGVSSLMGGLVRRARHRIKPDQDPKEKIHQLLQLVYGDLGFYCNPDNYFLIENLYLPHILENRVGMPVSLGAVVLYLADKLDLPLYPVNFPTQLILRAEVDGEVAFIDPWDGRYISQQQLQKLYEGAFGFGVEMQAEDLAVADIPDLLDRLQQLIKNTLIREELNEMALKYIEYLQQSHDDPYNIRDRGLVLAQMGCYHSAIEDLEYFVEQCPQDPTAFLLKAQLGELKQEIEQNFSPLH